MENVKKKKKALIVTSVGGFLPQYEMGNAIMLQDMGYEVHYASNFDKPVYHFDPVALENVGIFLHPISIRKKPKNATKNIKVIKQVKELIDSEGIDLIHCHNPMGGFVARMAAARSKAKPYVIYTAHGFHFYVGAPKKYWMVIYPIERHLARVTDALITINKEDYNEGRKLPLRIKNNCIHIDGVGVDLNRFHPNQEKRLEMRRKLEINDDDFHIVTAAEINDNKNHRVVIEALRRLDRSNIKYTICGDGEKVNELAELINENKLQNQVQLVGYQNKIEDYMCAADCTILSSKREGLPVAVLESFVCGVPMIVADNRGTRECAINDVNSIVCKYDDVDAFAEAIAKMQDDEEYRKKLASNCRESVKKFSDEQIMMKMKSVYEYFDTRIENKYE